MFRMSQSEGHIEVVRCRLLPGRVLEMWPD